MVEWLVTKWGAGADIVKWMVKKLGQELTLSNHQVIFRWLVNSSAIILQHFLVSCKISHHPSPFFNILWHFPSIMHHFHHHLAIPGILYHFPSYFDISLYLPPLPTNTQHLLVACNTSYHPSTFSFIYHHSHHPPTFPSILHHLPSSFNSF